MSDIWKDPSVKERLKEGVPATDIAVLSCPQCGEWGYYNEGTHFHCSHCKIGFVCVSEGEEPPDDCLYLLLETHGYTSLADTITETTDGYENQTLPDHGNR